MTKATNITNIEFYESGEFVIMVFDRPTPDDDPYTEFYISAPGFAEVDWHWCAGIVIGHDAKGEPRSREDILKEFHLYYFQNAIHDYLSDIIG